jgi:diguanylate cyclase
VVAAPRLLAVAPIAGLILHIGYGGTVASRLEGAAARRLFAAVRAVGSGGQDERSVAARAVERAARLLGADTVELILHRPDPLLARSTPSGQTWVGPPAAAKPIGGQIAEVMPVGETGESLGELRVFFADPVRLGERERSALGALATTLAGELRTAAAHTELAAMATAATHAATHDATTQLPGRQLLLSWIDEHLDQCRSNGSGRPVALICINIRGWAEILGELAAEVADRLLTHTAARLVAGAVGSERVAHIGGDTFAIWIPATTDLEHARERADNLLTVLTAPAAVELGLVVLSGVAGLVYALPSTLSGAEEALRQAHAALRNAHRQRLQVAVYRQEDDTRGQSAIVMASELRTAIRRSELELVYQPVLELATMRPVAVVAQTRWRHPSRGQLPAATWMPVLEQSELIGKYVPWLLDEALSAHTAWHQQNIEAPVAVLLPSPTLLDPALPTTIGAALANAKAAPNDLIIQPTGNWVLSNTDIIDRVLVDLAGRGIGLAVDIAGLSLEQLSRVPASEIRLSGHTTKLVCSDPETRAKVRAIVAFSDELGLRVIAQDIPTVEHIAALIELRVHAGQGPRMSQQWDVEQIASAMRQASEHALTAEDARVIVFPIRDH